MIEVMMRDIQKLSVKVLMCFIILMGAFSPLVNTIVTPSIAYAQDGANPPTSGSTSTTPTTSGASSDTNKTQTVEAQECGFMDVGCSIIKVYVSVMSAIPIWLATGSGVVLDYTLWYTTDSGTYTNQDGVDSFVVKGWKMIRDFSNLVFIFGLLFIGFVLIFNLSGDGGKPLFGIDPERGIIQVILMALLINFSFLMCRAIIDVSNVVANTFYSKIATNEKDIDTVNTQNATVASSGGQSANSLGDISNVYSNVAGVRSVSLGILAKSDPQRLLLKDGNPVKPSFGNYSEVIGTYFMVAIFNLFLTYIFISSAIFILMRTIGLWFLIILSPLAFVSRIIPAMKEKEYFGFDDWFKQLVGLAVSAPIFLFFMYLAVTFLNVDTAANTGSGLIGTIISIAIKLGTAGIVLILGRKISKDYAGKIGSLAGGVVSNVIAGGTMIAATAATGGGMAALKTTGQLFKSGAGSTLRGIGNATLGKDYTDKLASGSGDGLKRLNNFNPYKGGASTIFKDTDLSKRGLRNFAINAVNVGGVGVVKNTLGALGEAARVSGTTSTVPSFGEVVKQQQIESLDKKTKKIDEDLKNPNLSQKERQNLKKEKQEIEKEKWNINNADKVKSDSIKTTPTRENQQKKLATIEQKIVENEEKTNATNDAASKQKLTEEKEELQKEKSTLEKEFAKVDLDYKQKNKIDDDIKKDLKEITEQLKKTDSVSQKGKFDDLKNKEKNLRDELERLDKNQVTMTRLKNINYEQKPSVVNKLLTSISGMKEQPIPTPLYEVNNLGNESISSEIVEPKLEGLIVDRWGRSVKSLNMDRLENPVRSVDRATDLLSGISTNENPASSSFQDVKPLNIPVPPKNNIGQNVAGTTSSI